MRIAIFVLFALLLANRVRERQRTHEEPVHFNHSASPSAEIPKRPSGPRFQGQYTVSHGPEQPRSGQPVIITASLDPATPATLQIQVVEPGDYIPQSNPSFEGNWRDYSMSDSNGVLKTIIPGEIQKHRRLIRYRLKLTNANNQVVYLPDDAHSSPNFAWFVYDGVPPWTGASRPGKTRRLTFEPDFLQTLPVYHLIARREDVERSQWDHSANKQPFFGTFVYNGRVYDHIRFQNRGQASTYVAGKNKWGIKFNSGQEFAARDNYGRAYSNLWEGLNLNPCASAWAQVNRGMAGMDEAVSYRAYQLAGAPSPDTFWIHYRVIDSADESPSHQYDTDLWGLYLVVQEKKGSWLREKGLPDGNIYSIDGGPKHFAARGEERAQEYSVFLNGSHRSQSERWWRENLDLPAYYSFHGINRLVANIDLRPTGNFYLYHRPDDKWVIVPHDLDMMFIPKTHQPGYVPQARSLDHPALHREFQNRAREILDLFASDPAPDGAQIGQLVAEYATVIMPPGHERSWAELDEALWNWHPRNRGKGQFYANPARDHRMGGHWERTLDTADFQGFCKYLIQFCTDSRPRKDYRRNDGNQLGYGFGYLWNEAHDPDIPERPAIQFSNDRREIRQISITPFSSPVSSKFAALHWRIAEIAPADSAKPDPGRYEIEQAWITEFLSPITEWRVPPEALSPGRTWRIRARYKDDTGRCSHWSAPIQFRTAN